MMKDLEIWITRLVYLVYARYSVHLPSLSIYQTGLSLSEGITINIISKQKIIKTSSWRMNYRKNDLLKFTKNGSHSEQGQLNLE